MIRRLILSGVDVDQPTTTTQTAGGCTPLCIAAQFGHVVGWCWLNPRHLKLFGLSFRNLNMISCFQTLLSNSMGSPYNVGVVDLLIAAGADVNWAGPGNLILSMFATSQCSIELKKRRV